jgi:hypothetical protein
MPKQEGKILQAAAGLRSAVQSMHQLGLAAAQLLEKFQSDYTRLTVATEGLAAQIREHQPTINRIAQVFSEYFNRWEPVFAKHQTNREILALGWLPHPFQTELHNEIAELTDLDEKLSNFYENNLAAFEISLTKNLEKCGCDDILLSRVTYCFRSYRDGQFSQIPCALFPEIERYARENLYTENPFSNITSLRDVRDTISSLPLSYLTAPVLERGFYLFKIFDEHLYKSIKTTEQWKAARKIDIPNRHAALHGLVVYDSAKSSINTFIIFEYAILSIHALASLEDAETAA